MVDTPNISGNDLSDDLTILCDELARLRVCAAKIERAMENMLDLAEFNAARMMLLQELKELRSIAQRVRWSGLR